METLTLAPVNEEPYGDVPLGVEAFVSHPFATERKDHEDRAEPREIRSYDAWRG